MNDATAARTGREALALAASHPPDAIILDLGLPDIDGTEVIVELRRDEGNITGEHPHQVIVGNLTSAGQQKYCG